MRFSTTVAAVGAIAVVGVLVAPLPAAAQIVPEHCQGGICGFCDFFVLINNIYKWLVQFIATPLAAIAFAWAGVLYIFSRGNTGQIEQAKSIMFNAVVGILIAWGSFMIVSTVLQALGGDLDSILTGSFDSGAIQVQCQSDTGGSVDFNDLS